jgi:hypothetical protein
VTKYSARYSLSVWFSLRANAKNSTPTSKSSSDRPMNRSEFPPFEVLFHGQGGSRACQTHARRPRDSLVSPFATSTHGSGRNHVSRFATWRVKTLPFRVICFHPQQRSPFRSRTHTNPLPCSTQTSSLPPRCASLIPAPSASHPRRAALALKPTPRPRSPSSRPRNASTPPRRMRGACVPGVPFRASWPGPSCQTRHHRAWRVTRLDSSQRAPRRAPVPTKGTAPRGFRTQEVRRFDTAFFAQIASQRRFDASVVSYRTRLRPFATFRLVLAHALVLRLSTRKHVERTNGASEETSKRPDTDLAAALFHPNTDMRSTP